MNNARDLINAHLYPLLATAGTIVLGLGVVNIVQINQKMGSIEQEANYFNHCMKTHIEENSNFLLDEIVTHCNGNYRDPKYQPNIRRPAKTSKSQTITPSLK